MKKGISEGKYSFSEFTLDHQFLKTLQTPNQRWKTKAFPSISFFSSFSSSLSLCFFDSKWNALTKTSSFIVDNAYNSDPRISKFRKAEIDEKAAKKKAKADAIKVGCRLNHCTRSVSETELMIRVLI